MPETPLHYKTISEVAGLIEGRVLSPVEVTGAMLERINALDGHLKSYATVMADHALESAQRAEREIAAGEYRGPLHGIPIAVKDLCFTRGVRTMGGSKVYADHVPVFDSTVVERLEDRRSGASRQAQPDRGRDGRVQPRVSDTAQPLGQRPVERRVFQRIGSGDSRRTVLRITGKRHWRLDTISGVGLRNRRPEANMGPCQPVRSFRPCGVARPRRPDDSQLSRRGYHAPGDRGPRLQRCHIAVRPCPRHRFQYR